ncbi:TolC family protein [Halobacteriovorax sp. HLS]|uniref:TolC family protein n=1 Tax=Halobacteriovorax sp. HLS TaxID=2234000 RepID=UPI000FD76583|nr:TolC family protein [Halobacteriovorax sp. HLS]
MKTLLVNISILFIFTQTAQASLSKLSNEYISSGSDNESARMDLEINQVSKELVFESKPWVLSATSSHVNSNLNSSLTQLPSDSSSQLYELGVSKQFFSGTSVVFSNALSDYENNLSSTSNNTGFTQSLTLSQDLWKNFLGRNDKLDREIADKTYVYQERANEALLASNLYTFVTEYLEVKVNKALLSLQEMTVDRAQKRLDLIKRRVRDGLSEKVDLFSAQTRDLAAKENLRSLNINLESSLESLSKRLHRKVSKEEVEAYKIQVESELSKVEGVIEDNQSLKSTFEQINYLESTFLQKKNSVYPNLNLTGKYAANNYQSSGNPISNGTLGNEDDELTIGLTLSWNMGSITERLARESSSISLNKAKMINRKQLLTLKQQESFLLKRVVEVESLLETALKRLKISEKTLEEYNRLYSRGRANLDQVIRAEEDLIDTQVSYVRYLIRRDTYYASQAFLYGKLNKAIFK